MLGGVPCTDGEMYEGVGDSLCRIGRVSACLVEFHVQIH
jgi:hypothetical protein